MEKPRPKEKEWFITAFGWLYPLIYSHRDDSAATGEVRRLVDLLGLFGKRASILDVCCGGGRHTVELVRLGFEVKALDLSPALLELAAARPELAGCLVRSDMRALGFSPGFDLVTNLFTSFGYFTEAGENERALAEMVRVLRPGGRLVMDHINRPTLEAGLVARDTVTRKDLTIHQRRRIEGNRVIKEIEVIKEDGETHQWCENVRIFQPSELEALFQAHGLGKVEFYGTFDGKDLAEDSPRMIAVATREGA